MGKSVVHGGFSFVTTKQDLVVSKKPPKPEAFFMQKISWYIRYHQFKYWTFFKNLELRETLSRRRAQWRELFAYDIILSFDDGYTKEKLAELNGDPKEE